MNGGIVRPPGGKQQTNNLRNFHATITSLRPRELRGLSQGSFYFWRLLCGHLWGQQAAKASIRAGQALSGSSLHHSSTSASSPSPPKKAVSRAR